MLNKTTARFRAIGIQTLSVLALCAAILLGGVGAARADAIDGNWCSPKGRHMSIDGPRIVTPGGTKMKGEYDRHGFRYVVPKPEKGAGAKVDMRLISDDILHVQTGKAATVIWRRCRSIS